MDHGMKGFMAKNRSGANPIKSAKATKKGKQAKSVAPQPKNLLNGKVKAKQLMPGKIKG